MTTLQQNSTSDPGARPSRALARLYDQQLRFFAANYRNMGPGPGRASSSMLIVNYFHELVGLVRPNLFIEAGAFQAEASRRVKNSDPTCRVVAFEANPYNFRAYADEIQASAPGVEYVHLAVTDKIQPVTFFLRTAVNGEPMERTTGSSSLLERQDHTTRYEEITVDGVTLDSYFPENPDTTAALWIDVEGASGSVLQGGRRLLDQTAVVLIELEEKEWWQGQWRSLDVIEFFLDAGFTPLTRDIEYINQYNMIFVRNDVYERSEILWAQEQHTNYVVQHVSHRDLPD